MTNSSNQKYKDLSKNQLLLINELIRFFDPWMTQIAKNSSVLSKISFNFDRIDALLSEKDLENITEIYQIVNALRVMIDRQKEDNLQFLDSNLNEIERYYEKESVTA